MAGIFEEVQMREDAYANNPQALQQRYAQSQQLVDLLALQKVNNEQQAAARNIQAQMETNPSTVKDQLGLQALSGARSEIVSELAPGIRQRGQQMQQMAARQSMGMPSMNASNMQRMADGGIVGFDGTNGSQVKDSSFPDLNKDGKVTYGDVLKGRGVEGFAPGGRAKEQGREIEDLLTALMIAESGGDPTAVSRAGAEGAYQIMPSTAADPGFGVAPMKGSRFDPKASREFAKQYLQAMLDRYDGDTEAALIAYNAGAGNADKFIAAGRDYDVLPQAMQTRPYVENIMGQLERGVREPSPGLIASRQTARKGLGFLRDARDFATSLFDETEATKERRKEQEEFNRIVRARNEGLGTLEVEDDVTETQEVMTPSGMTGDQLTAQLVAMDDPSPISYLQGLGIKQQARKDRFANMFPGAQEAVDSYAANKEMGGIGALRQAGRMQEQQRQRDTEEARRAANYLLMQGRTNDMLTQLNPAMSFEDIEEVGVEGFDEGGGVQERIYEATKDYMPDFGKVVSGAGELIGDTFFDADDKLGSATNIALLLASLSPQIAATRLGIAGLAGLKQLGPKALQAIKKGAQVPFTKPARGIDGGTIVRNNPKTGKLENFRQFSPARTVGTVGLGTSVASNILSGDDTETEEVPDTTVEEIIRKTPPPPPPPKKSGLAGANIDFDMLRQQGAAAAGGTTTGQSLALAGAATGTEQARREQVAEKRRSDQERNAIYAEQVAATLAAGNQRRQSDLIEAFLTYLQTENRAQMESDVAMLAGVSSYDDLTEAEQAQFRLDAATNFVRKVAGLGGTGEIAMTPALAAALAKYSGNPRQ